MSERGTATLDPRATLVVTRPADDAARLIDALRSRGRDVLALPVLAIEPADDPSALAATMARLDDYALVVFVSPNAIRQALAYRCGPWPPATTIGVMGPGSVDALAAVGIAEPGHRVVSPARVPPGAAGDERFDSESLFTALDAQLGLQQGFARPVLIVRGNGGRAWFAERLRALGIEVDEIAAYRRVRPDVARHAGDALRRLHDAGTPIVFVVTSSEGVDHLVALAEEALVERGVAGPDARTWVLEGAVLAPHRRIADRARSAGFGAVALCAPGDDGILAAIE